MIGEPHSVLVQLDSFSGLTGRATSLRQADTATHSAPCDSIEQRYEAANVARDRYSRRASSVGGACVANSDSARRSVPLPCHSDSAATWPN